MSDDASYAAVKPTILLVDDDHANRETIRDILEEEGYQVCTATNGREALALLPALDRPGVVILDLMMPVMNGWELLEVARARGLLVGVRVLVATAAGSELSDPAGGYECLRKPMGLEELFAALRRLAGPT
jgi:CheY-like chemotaxis protein